MNCHINPTEDEKEKYSEMFRRGASISDLRSIKEEKEDRLEKIKSDIRRNEKLFKYSGGGKKVKKKIHNFKEKSLTY